MTKKEKQITELYLNTTLEVASNVDNWLSFLKSASYNYKYRFDEQVLIYAQRPDATACAETITWNKKLKRWINKGAKGIALIDERKGEMGLRFVFDVSDTNSNVYGKQFKLWTAEDKYNDSVIETLEENFGTIDDKKDLDSAIIEIVYKNVQENMYDYFEELKSVSANSKLEELDDDAKEYIFRNILMFSTISLTLSRCGIDPMKYFQKSDFADIQKFDTFETISILGTATRDFSKEILLQISKTIIDVQKNEKNINRTFVKDKKEEYDKNIEKEKGSVENEYNIYNERELPNTRPSATRENEQESGIRQIRPHEIELSENKQEGNLHNITNEQQIDRPLDRDTRNSQEENTTNSGTNEENLWNNGRDESTRPDGMGRTDEQHTTDSRTDGSERVNLQLEQDIEKGADNASFFDEETIKKILNNAPNVIKNENEFRNFIFDNHEDKEKCKNYIKDILGNAYTEFDVDNQRVGYKVNDNNLNIWKDNYLNRTEECFKSWDLITEYYISNIVLTITPEYNQDIYYFRTGDIIYLDSQEYRIADIDGDIFTVYDERFPLFQDKINIKEVMQKIALNPLNDYLKEERPEEIKEERKPQENSFNKWLDTFIDEKGIDTNQIVEVKTENNTHFFEIGNIIENIKATTREEQEQIKDMIVKIDFHNGDVIDYFSHLAKALADNFEKQFEEKEQEVNDEIAKKIIKKSRNIEYFDLHPEIPPEERNNFKIKNDDLGIGTAKEKFRNNIEAIKVLKTCEKENRYATVEEQQILSKYVGWGGLKSAFDEQSDSWGNEYAELKSLLTEEEYKNARESSLTAYYTPPLVIRNIYKALQNMGLKEANILEPSCRNRKLYWYASSRTR